MQQNTMDYDILMPDTTYTQPLLGIRQTAFPKSKPQSTNLEKIKTIFQSTGLYYCLIFIFQIVFVIYYVSSLVSNNGMSTGEIQVALLCIMSCQGLMAFLRFVEICFVE